MSNSPWNKFSQGTTPGTTPLPQMLPQFVPPSLSKTVVDIGCGWGRGSFWLHSLGYSVVGTDINPQEISQARKNAQELAVSLDTLRFQIDDASKKINLPNSIADAVVVNGVMLALTNPSSRVVFIDEIARILKKEGILYLAEFAQTSNKDYPVDYRKHSLITGEYGTIVSFKPELKISFKDKSDEEVLSLNRPENIQYFAHHYSEAEIKSLLSPFKILSFDLSQFTTRSGKHPGGFVIYAQKP